MKRPRLSVRAHRLLGDLDEKLKMGLISKTEYDRRFASLEYRDRVENHKEQSKRRSESMKPKFKPRGNRSKGKNSQLTSGEPKLLEHTSGALRGHMDPSKLVNLKKYILVVPGGAPGTGKH
jgi:hypothetical protein